MNRAPMPRRGARFWLAPAVGALMAAAAGGPGIAQTGTQPSPPVLTPLPPFSQHEAPRGDDMPPQDPSGRDQTTQGDPATQGEAAQGEAPKNDAAAAPEEDLDPAAALDKAFADLKSEDETTRAQAGQRIVKLWSRSGSASMDLLLQRGRDAIEREDYAAAKEHLTDLVTLAPGFAEGWHMRAQVHAMQDDYAGALLDLAETVAIEQRHFLAFAELGALLEDLGHEQEALKAFRSALEIFPAFEPAKNAVERLAPSVDGRGA